MIAVLLIEAASHVRWAFVVSPEIARGMMLQNVIH